MASAGSMAGGGLTAGAGGSRLRLPVRVRVTPDAAGGPSAQTVRARVADAVAAACARLPLAQLGIGPADVRTVTVRAQSGGAGPQAPDGLLTAAKQGAIDGAAHAGLRSRAAARGPGRVHGEWPAEPFDPSRARYTPTGMTYEIPFFDGGTTRVPLRAEPGSGPAPSLPRAGETVSVAEAIEIAWRWHVHRHGGWAADRELPGYNGLIRLPSGEVARCYVFLFDIRAVGPDGAPVPGLFAYLVDRDEADVDDDLTLVTLALEFRGRPETGWLSRERGHGVTGSMSHAGDVIPIRFVTQDDLAGPAGGTGAGGGGRSARGAHRRTGSGRGLDGHPGGNGGALRVGDPLPPGGSGSALRSEPGAGDVQPENPPVGSRAVWPSAPPVPHRLADLLGLTEDLASCRPFFVEPELSQLTDVRNLAGRMRALAAALDLPECGYLGTFALHCAQVLTLHAHGVGVAGAGSLVCSQVTVRADASGNNGYVDVRPAPSPDLDRLRHLAGLARQLRQFADDVVDTYGDARNVAMVGVSEELLPYYGGWTLRFLRDFGSAMSLGYETIFTEACRLLLLQQLRSSATGIAGRREQTMFALVVDDLRMKLETLGDLVLWPTILLQTIEHAERLYLTSGSVREVLSIGQTANYGDVMTTLPPPVDATPRRVLARVENGRLESRGGERVVVLDGIAYTAAALRDMVNKRRAVLNASDPLFLQIPNIEWLVLLDEGGPAQLENYLRTLLTEMADANQKMTDRATEASDGGYFALEASQYLVREGGRDARGLRYTLQGIHQLAHDLLAPQAGDDPYYADGVNQAIDHKAGSDLLLTIASTAGIIVLGLLCAPLEAVVAGAITGAAGIALAAHDVLDAQRQSDLYRALEDPEVFEHWQDVQLAQLMAIVGVALSVFDAVAVGRAGHELASGALAAMKVAERQGARTAVRLVSAQARERVLRGLTEEVLARALREAVAQGVVLGAMNLLLPQVIEPILVPWMRRQAQEHGTLAEVDAALGRPATGRDHP